jgi:cyclic beta-1,2-glucan synthetase
VAVESILGVTVMGGRTLVIEPRIPAIWPGFTLCYRLPDHDTRYQITVRNEAGTAVAEARLDGILLTPEAGRWRVPLSTDGACHELRVRLQGPLPR